MEKKRFNPQILTGPFSLPNKIPDIIKRYPGNGRLDDYREKNFKQSLTHLKYSVLQLLTGFAIGALAYPDLRSNTVEAKDIIAASISLIPLAFSAFHDIAFTKGVINEKAARKIQDRVGTNI
ncbi:MAG TPA: hypothetical protein VF189_00580 [Patescibacteria group bacterium]